MKKAIIIGGSNGIGLAIANNLINQNYYLEICDLLPPDEEILDSKCFNFTYLNLLDYNEETVEKIAKDQDAEILMISAGIGRIADFQFHHIAEIEKIMTVDAVSIIKILRQFYDRILNSKPFYTGVMCSISSKLSSPSASVYSAAKAAIARFIESVNIELEVYNAKNRILDISPASFSGSRFYGGKNDLQLMNPLANDIIVHIFSRNTLFIPEYTEKYKTIINRYQENPHDYGLYSWKYKKESGRLDNSRKVIIGYLSGTFDLFHIGHLNLLRRAKQQCDYLIVGVHDSGAWKGKETFIPLEERKAIVAACKYVNKVVDSCREDSDAWELWKYDKLFVGSDYKGTDRFMRYEKILKDKGVEIVYLSYTQSTSSTMIRNSIKSKMI